MESTAYSLLQHNCQFTLGKNIPIWAKQLRLTVFITGFQFPRSQPRTQEFILTPDIKKKTLTKSKLIPISKIVLANISSNLKQKIAVDLI
jgi:hypothetical protein